MNKKRFSLPRLVRPNPLWSGLSDREGWSSLARGIGSIRAGDPGPDAGREPASRTQDWVGAGLYALLVPFGMAALWGRYFLTGILLAGIGLTGVLGLVVRNLGAGSREGRRP